MAEHLGLRLAGATSVIYRPAVVICALALVVTGCGSSSQETIDPSSGSAQPAVASPAARPPNGSIDIGGGRHLLLNCGGSGTPAVILEAGLGNTADVWTQVVAEVRQFTTVCSYDRAGLGGSDPRPPPHGAGSAADDLQQLVSVTGLPGPYVMVGASYGGLVAQLFARRHPGSVAGVVLVDAIAPRWDDRLEALLSPAQVDERRAIPTGEDLTNEDIRASESDVETAPPFPEVPLVVLRHGLPFPGGPDWPTDEVEGLWMSLQVGLASLSSQSTLLVATTSGHRIHQQQPDLVAAAIHAIVDPARWPPSAPPAEPAFGEGAAEVAVGTIPGRFVFSAPDGIRSARADGSDSQVVVPSGDALLGEPSIDAAGRYLAYARHQAGPASAGPQPGDAKVDIWVHDEVTRSDRLIASDGQNPSVSPDGRYVAFSAKGHLFAIRPDASDPVDLGEGGCAVWAPDSKSLASCTVDDTVVLVRLSDMTRTAVSTMPGPMEPTAWSPDGKALALFAAGTGNGEIHLINVEGRGERELTSAPGNQNAVLWIEQGLVVTSSLPGAEVSDWFLVDPSTGEPALLGWMRGLPDPIAYDVPR